MPENIRALVVVIILACIAFMLNRNLIAGYVTPQAYKSRRNAWLFLTTSAFLVQNFWFYTVILILFISVIIKKERNIVALYAFLLMLLPTGSVAVPGLGIANYLIELNYQKLISILLLLPALFSAIKVSNKTQGQSLSGLDRFIFLYVLLLVILEFRDTTVTDALRHSLYYCIEILLPYFAISRYIKNPEQLKDIIFSLTLGIMIVSLIGTFEYIKSWLLYLPVYEGLELTQKTNYQGRANMLRASVTTGHPIALGLATSVGIGCYLYLNRFQPRGVGSKIGGLFLLTGLLSSLSRGPWLGALIGWICFTLLGPSAISKLLKALIIGILGIGLLSVTPSGEKYINLLPFVGKTESENITYRENLFNNSMIVFKRNLWTGSPNFLEAPEMEEMRNGEHIIDIVNSYLGIALASGAVGLFLFCGFFFLILKRLYHTAKSISKINIELHIMGRALFGSMSAILFTIFTTSSIGIIPYIYWAFAGICAAYIKVVSQTSQMESSREPN